ncbi:hypothetical protein D9Q98_002905 [Chlorella vulgaris]|uniref:Nudix hydrolase domain-containing protein n=1 Tax=Chlorella vulgaris TaxID=3077 RepID=A0A9D4TUF9_CHLVU|nr:hypothetical protein D9Q98_002905 [Chlorella vulgaris]
MLAATARLNSLAFRARVQYPRTRCCASMSQPVPAQSTLRRQVVTAFVQRPSDAAVLLVLRSDKVGTYQHKWGAVSGGIEGEGESPVSRAQQEIVEETGLTADQVTLVRSGRPLAVNDGRLHFCVHPFLFCLRPEHCKAQATLNWENEGAAWVAPEAIPGLNAVPLLWETYRHLHLPIAHEAAVQRLLSDRQSGATQLAATALGELQQAAKALAEAEAEAGSDATPGGGAAGGSEVGGGGEAALQDLCSLGYHLAVARPSMAAVANSVAAVLAATQEELQARAGTGSVTVREVTSVLQTAAAAEQHRLATAAAELSQQATAVLAELSAAHGSKQELAVMTLSYSSSVLAALKAFAAQGRKLHVTVCESRPLCEGVQLAGVLAGAGIQCTLITDAQAAVFIDRCQAVLVGADAVTPTAAVNKVGTCLLALAARHFGVPVYALADSGKLSPGPLEALAHPGLAAPQQEEEEKAAGEVTVAWNQAAPGVAVRNVYFEPTPLELVTALITESGKLERGAIAAAVHKRRELYKAAFQLC